MEIKELGASLKAYRGKSIVLWGAGVYGKYVLSFFQATNFNVTHICDGDPEKRGSTIQDVPVISPEQLEQLCGQSAQTSGGGGDFIVQIAISPNKEHAERTISSIADQLKAFGISEIQLPSAIHLTLPIFRNYAYAEENLLLDSEGVRERLSEFYDSLCDEQSKKILAARIHKDYEDVLTEEQALLELQQQASPRCQAFLECSETERRKMVLSEAVIPADSVIIFVGTDEDSQKAYLELMEDDEIRTQILGNRTWLFCDNEPEKGAVCQGLPVISLEDDLIRYKESGYFIILTKKNPQSLVLFFDEHEINYKQVSQTFSYFDRTEQYFDPQIIRLGSQEIFVDAGVLNAENSILFYKNTRHTCKHLYLFEPNSTAQKNSVRNLELEHIENYTMFPYGLWDQEEALKFSGYAGCFGAAQSEQETFVEVPVNTLDALLGDTEVTFIKMDIEGAELAALTGAKQIIFKYKPTLAISLYHKPEDLLEIPYYIKNLVPEYQFFLRHYATNCWETVLYGVLPRE